MIHKSRKEIMSNKKRFFHYLGKQKKNVVLIILFSLLFVIAQISQPFLLGRALDSALNEDNQSFYIFLSVALGLAIVGIIAGYIFEVVVGTLSQNMIKDIRDDVYEKINSVSVYRFDQYAQGDLIQLEIRDVENIATGVFAVFKSLVQGILTIIVTILLMIMVNWILAIAVVLLSPLSVLMSSFVARFNHKHFKKQAALQAELNALSLEAISNIDIVQSLNYENKSMEQFEEINKKLQKEGEIAQFSASWINPSTRLVNNTIYVIIGIAGIIMFLYYDKLAMVFAVMSIGRLSSFLSYTTQYSKPFNEISGVIGEYEAAKFSFARINEFLNNENDVDEGKEVVQTINNIKFKDFYFSYSPDQRLIEDLSLEIKKGNKVAIVGPTGAGKTTLINLIMRFYDPQKGELLINGISAKSISKKSLRNSIGMVLQDTWIFNGTISDNVRYTKPNASEEEVIEACKKSHADTFINMLPDGYNTIISSSSGLSEGQKQMIAISRVMLLNPDIVILDEATSNIDTRSEKLITKAFDEIMENKTSIVIAHRLSTIENADIILVLKDGKIIEQGNHKSLMKKKKFYYSMYASQFK